MADAFSYLGVGIKDPISLTNGEADTVNRLALIEQSIRDILSVPQGTRFFVPDYGSRLAELMFAPNDAATANVAAVLTQQALTTWERRIEVASVQGNWNNARLDLTVAYRVKGQNEINSFVYPFYSKLVY